MLQTRWFNKYGSTLRYYSTNRTPLILTCDPTLVNHINTHPTEFEQPEFVFAFSRENMGPSLTASANADHRRQRRAIAPSFATPQLNVMTPLLLTKAFQLVEKIIEEVKERGEGREVEWVMFIQRLTVDVIGLAGFDLDFDTLGKGGSELLDAWRRQLGGGGDGRFVMLLQSWGVRVPMFLVGCEKDDYDSRIISWLTNHHRGIVGPRGLTKVLG
jgi:cytochrome P450